MIPEEHVERLAREILQVRMALGRVAVYEGILDVSPTAMLVDELVRDHEELEARIDAALHLISAALLTEVDEDDRHGHVDPVYALMAAHRRLARVAELLKGGSRVPDSPEGI